MPSCRTHPERPVRATCSRCGRAFCEECLIPDDSRPTCIECSIAATGGRLRRQALDSHARQAAASRANDQRRPTMIHFVIAACLIVAAGEAGAILFLTSPPKESAPPSAKELTQQAWLAQTTAEVLLLHAGLEAHRRRTGEYPESLTQIVSQLPLPIQNRIDLDKIDYVKYDSGRYRLRTTSAAGTPIVLDSEPQEPLFEEARR